ncbi:MAG: hypothetical protein M3443_18780 [Actinomycetota bacterium]|nr:hypothetical protein [Actinomycetota bacterium]
MRFPSQRNDGWYVQVLDGGGKVSGVVSSASAAIAAGSLLIPGVGQVVAPVAGTVAAASGGVNALTGLAQKGVGSGNAPNWVDIGLGLFPGLTATSGAVSARICSTTSPRTAAESATWAGVPATAPRTASPPLVSASPPRTSANCARRRSEPGH